MDIDWVTHLRDQLGWHWRHQLRDRLAGLTDDEYLWEPVAGCWSVRPRGAATTAMAAGGGDFTIDLASPEPQPAPVTTIAWRLGHVAATLATRTAAHFGGPPHDHATFPYAGTAVGALDLLDRAYAAWDAGVAALSPADLGRPCGPAEGPFADFPLAALVLHVNREVIHHGAEVALLRDLYARQRSPAGTRSG